MLPKEPAEEEFYLSLRNGLILCNVLNEVNPGAVYKVVIIYVDFRGCNNLFVSSFRLDVTFLVSIFPFSMCEIRVGGGKSGAGCASHRGCSPIRYSKFREYEEFSCRGWQNVAPHFFEASDLEKVNALFHLKNHV